MSVRESDAAIHDRYQHPFFATKSWWYNYLTIQTQFSKTLPNTYHSYSSWFQVGCYWCRQGCSLAVLRGRLPTWTPAHLLGTLWSFCSWCRHSHRQLIDPAEELLLRTVLKNMIMIRSGPVGIGVQKYFKSTYRVYSSDWLPYWSGVRARDPGFGFRVEQSIN